MGTIKKTVVGYFQQKGVRVTSLGQDQFFVGVRSANAKYECYISIYELTGYVLLDTQLPLQVPDEKKTDITKLVLYLNRAEIFGQFVFDESNGTLAYRNGSFVRNQDSCDSTIYGYLIECNISKADQYFALFAQVLYGNLDVEAYCCQDGDEESDDGLEESDSPNNTDTDFLNNLRNN